MATLSLEQDSPDQMGFNIYYKLEGKLSQWLVHCEVQPLEQAVEWCRKQVEDTLPNRYNLAVLAVINGGKA